MGAPTGSAPLVWSMVCPSGLGRPRNVGGSLATVPRHARRVRSARRQLVRDAAVRRLGLDARARAGVLGRAQQRAGAVGSPIKNMSRTVTRDAELHGETLHAGAARAPRHVR